MRKERILNKKFDRLNKLKALLLIKKQEGREDIIREIIDTIDDLELILDDFKYIRGDEIRQEATGYQPMNEL